MQTLLTYAREIINLPAVIQDLGKHRELIWSLTRRDFLSRFRGSLGGIFWSILQPFFMMIIYTLVFSSFLQVRFGISDSPYAFAVYLLCGLLPWTAFSESVTMSTGLIRGNTNLVKRVVFPLQILPVTMVLVSLLQQMIGLILLLPLAWWVTGNLNWTLLLIPFVLIIQTLLYIGVSWFWASLSVYLVDLKQITPLLITVGMFLTPIFYPAEIVPEWARFAVISLNPLASLINIYRQIILEGTFPDGYKLFSIVVTSLVVFLAGSFWFQHTKKGFADIL
ncbi:MAG: ABC transporter permease [Chloroflexota bacterium]